VGLKTLESIAAAGGRVLALEAGKTILLDQANFAVAARRLQISVVAVERAAIAIRVA
jgi:DUF1009 family protein